MAIPAVKSAIASQSDKCSALFHELADTVQNALPDSANRDQITEAFVQDELGRFRVWLGNVGAHRSGRVSLDYRLREATSLRDSVLELLKDLGDNLQEGRFASHFNSQIAKRTISLHNHGTRLGNLPYIIYLKRGERPSTLASLPLRFVAS